MNWLLEHFFKKLFFVDTFSAFNFQRNSPITLYPQKTISLFSTGSQLVVQKCCENELN